MKKNLIILSLLVFTLTFASCTNYGTKLMFDETELYYTKDITEDEANDIGKYLQEIGFTEGDEKTVQIAKDGDTYLFRMVVKESFIDDDEYEEIAYLFIHNLSADVLENNPVELQMCDEELKTLKTIKMDDAQEIIEDDYKIKTFDGTEIEYDNTVKYNEVDKLGNFLMETGFTDGTVKSIIFVKDKKTYVFKMVVDEASWTDLEYQDLGKEYARQMSSTIFNNNDVEIHFCNDYFEVQTKVKP